MKEEKRALFEAQISGALVAAASVVPLVFFPFGWDRYYLPKTVCLYALCLWMLFLCLRYREGMLAASFPGELRAPAALLAGWCGWIVLATFFSIDPALSLAGSVWRREGTFTLLCYGLLLLFAMGAYRYSPRHLTVYLASASLCAWYGVMQRLGWELLPIDERRALWVSDAFSTAGNPNFFGSFVTLALSVAGWACIRKGGAGRFAAAALLYYALLCSETQSAWIGSAVSFLLMAAVFLKTGERKEKARVFYLLFPILALTALYEIQFHTVLYEISSVFTDFSRLVAYATGHGFYEAAVGGGKYRIFIWECALRLIRQRPLVGFGPECMRQAIAGWLTVDFRPDLAAVLDRAHNEYLHMAVSGGVPAAGGYIGLIALAVRNGTKFFFIRDERLGLTCAVVGYAVQAFFNISTSAAAPVFWIFLGILLRGDRAARKGERKRYARDFGDGPRQTS